VHQKINLLGGHTN